MQYGSMKQDGAPGSSLGISGKLEFDIPLDQSKICMSSDHDHSSSETI